MSYIIVGLGGALGAAMRHGVNRFAVAQWGAAFPVGTLLVNVVGSFAMGLLAGLFLARAGAAEGWRLFLTTGVLGGFTTFSAFSLEAALMWQRNDYRDVAAYVSGSVLLAILALFLGLAAARTIS